MGKLGAGFVLLVLLVAGCSPTVVVRDEPDEADAEAAAGESPEPQDLTLGPLGLVVCIADEGGIRCEHSTNLSGIPLSPVKNGPPYAYTLEACADPGTEWSCSGRFVGQGNDELPYPRSAWRHESRPPVGPWWCLTRHEHGVVEGVTCGNGDSFMDTQPQPGESVFEMGGCSMGEFDGTLSWTCRGTLFRTG